MFGLQTPEVTGHLQVASLLGGTFGTFLLLKPTTGPVNHQCCETGGEQPHTHRAQITSSAAEQGMASTEQTATDHPPCTLGFGTCSPCSSQPGSGLRRGAGQAALAAGCVVPYSSTTSSTPTSTPAQPQPAPQDTLLPSTASHRPVQGHC